MKKFFYFTILLFVQASYSQTYTFNKISEHKYNENKKEFVLIEGTTEFSKTIVFVDEIEKTIKISRKFVASNSTEVFDTAETYYFVKKETIQNFASKYFAVDLNNKKYLEIMISKDEAAILENCNGFNGCETLILFNN